MSLRPQRDVNRTEPREKPATIKGHPQEIAMLVELLAEGAPFSEFGVVPEKFVRIVDDGRKLDTFDAVVSSGGRNVKPLCGGHGVISTNSERPW